MRVLEVLARYVAGERWLADPEGESAPRSEPDDAVTVVVGPEGGLTQSEREAFQSAGYLPVRLGPYTLRFETAALAAAALVAQRRNRGVHV